MDTEDHKSISLFLSSVGGFGIVIGGQALMNALQTGTTKGILASIGMLVGGLVLLIVGLFWHRFRPSTEGRFTEFLARWASNPAPYAAMILMVWIYIETLALARNNEIIALRNDDHSIAEVLNRLVLPRQLTQDQIQAIASFLQQFPPQNYSLVVAQGDEEAGMYRANIQTALTKGGWKLKTITNILNPPNDLQIDFRQTTEHAQSRRDDKLPTPGVLVQMAFGLVGARIGGSGAGTDAKLAEDEVTITIGHRRRDAYAYALPCEETHAN